MFEARSQNCRQEHCFQMSLCGVSFVEWCSVFAGRFSNSLTGAMFSKVVSSKLLRDAVLSKVVFLDLWRGAMFSSV